MSCSQDLATRLVVEFARRLRQHAAALELLPSILARYPFGIWHTGGGCFALRLNCGGGEYILVTEVEAARVPTIDACEVDAGRYAANADPVGDTETVAVNGLEQWIEAALSKAREPANVADYLPSTLAHRTPIQRCMKCL